MITKRRDAYTSRGRRDLHVDWYEPSGPESTRTAVILLHGGAWRMGEPALMAPYGERLAENGFVALVPEYRLLGEAPWPAPIDDVKAAIRWVRAHADRLGIDAGKIALCGMSAGGHLSLLAAGTPGRGEHSREAESVAGVVAFFAPVAFASEPEEEHEMPASLLLEDAAPGADAETISPATHITPGFPPTFLLHGTEDRMVPCQSSQHLFDLLRAHDVPAELHLYPGHTHEFQGLPSMLESVMIEVISFLHRLVVDPQKYKQESLELNPFASGVPPGT